MRFLPATRRLCERVAAGAIGEVQMLSANFGHRPPYDPTSRFFDPELGGGAQLDIGVYSLSLAVMLLGMPDRVTGVASIGATGVDEQAATVLSYSDGRLAVALASLRTVLPTDAVISGSEGEIRLSPLYRPERLSLRRFADGASSAPASRWRARIRRVLARRDDEHVPFEGNGFNYEAAEAMRCLGAGLTESPLMPLEESVQVMEVVDAAQRQWSQEGR